MSVGPFESHFCADPQHVLFIKDVVIELMPPTRVIEYAEWKPMLVDFRDPPMIPEHTIKTIRVPVETLERYNAYTGREKVLFAMSRDVERFLEIPLSALRERVERAEKAVFDTQAAHEVMKHDVRTAPLKTRLKYLFTRKLV